MIDCPQTELVTLYALGALPASESEQVVQHVAVCASCQRELASLRPVVGSLEHSDILKPQPDLWGRLAERLKFEPSDDQSPPLAEPPWSNVAPGISCKILSRESAGGLVSMLVRLDPGTDYPPHMHAAVEELHLLDGELWINQRKLYPGDYNRAEPGTSDQRVWSETGCTCVLITSASDRLTVREY